MNLFQKLFGRKSEVKPAVSSASSAPAKPQPEPLRIDEISAGELAELLQTDSPPAVIDLRQGWEYASGHIPGAISVPINALPLHLERIPQQGKVVLQCYHGFSSLGAAGYLIEQGWGAENVSSLMGGMSGWVTSQGMDALARSE